MDHLRLLLDSEDGVETGCDSCDESFMIGHCAHALETQTQLSIAQDCIVEISVQLLTPESMRQLNHQYRNKDAPTNVLSFESGLPPLQQSSTEWLLSLGDLVFCPDLLIQQARQQNKSLKNHWAHLLIHGTLHLCGFDHEKPSQANVMESLEIQILSGSGIADPYQVQPRQ